MINNWGVYILHGDRYYVGSTNNLTRRLDEHYRGKTHTTKRIGQFKLVQRFSCATEDEARALEMEIKKSGHYERRITTDL